MLRVRWYFRPIAPICNAKRAASRQDLQNFTAGVFEAIAELQVGRRLLIHCIQGFHRTGVFLLLLLVARGYATDAALRRIHDIRYMTWYELAKRWSWKNRPQTLLPKALNIVELVKNGWGDGDCNIARGFDAERRTGRHKKYSASWDCRSCSVVANYPHRFFCRKCGAMRPRDTRVDEARRWRDIVDRQQARVRKHRPPIVMEQFGVGIGCA